MTADELTRHIREAMKTEESAITIYASHLSAIVSRSGLPESKIAQIRKTLQNLIRANREHKEFLAGLLKRVQGESIDVY